MKVREVMSKDVLVASPDDTIEKAARLADGALSKDEEGRPCQILEWRAPE
jgi:CBS domain-containing protein